MDEEQSEQYEDGGNEQGRGKNLSMYQQMEQLTQDPNTNQADNTNQKEAEPNEASTIVRLEHSNNEREAEPNEERSMVRPEHCNDEKEAESNEASSTVRSEHSNDKREAEPNEVRSMVRPEHSNDEKEAESNEASSIVRSEHSNDKREAEPNEVRSMVRPEHSNDEKEAESNEASSTVRSEHSNDKREAEPNEVRSMVRPEHSNDEKEAESNEASSIVRSEHSNNEREAEPNEERSMVRPEHSINEGDAKPNEERSMVRPEHSNDEREAESNAERSMVRPELSNNEMQADPNEAGSMVRPEHSNNERQAEPNEERSTVRPEHSNDERKAEPNEERSMVRTEHSNDEREAEPNEERSMVRPEHSNDEREAKPNEERLMVRPEHSNDKREAEPNEERSMVRPEHCNDEKEAESNEASSTVRSEHSNDKREAEPNEVRSMVRPEHSNDEKEAESNEASSIVRSEHSNDKREAEPNEVRSMVKPEHSNDEKEAESNEASSIVRSEHSNNEREAESNEERSMVRPEHSINEKEAEPNEAGSMIRPEHSNNERQAEPNEKRSMVRPELSNKDGEPHFFMLQNLVKLESEDIISQLDDNKKAFVGLLRSPIDRLDVFALVFKLLAKVCQSTDQLKLVILNTVCKSPFILSLRNYIADLPYPEFKAANTMYWESPDEFWVNLLTFCECVTTSLPPSTALAACRFLIDGTLKLYLEELGKRHGYELPESCDLMLIKLRETLTELGREKTESGGQLKKFQVDDGWIDEEPPESFRELSVLPDLYDFMNERPYLRANVVKGGYRDVEHYLDVQFRLLREDCFGPLREGIRQFIENPKKGKYDNIRVFRNVKFLRTYVSPQKIGVVMELDEATKRRFKNIDWANNKRFIFGSLVLFTRNDDCKCLIAATILNKEVKLLREGKIPVTTIHDREPGYYYLDNIGTYTMIESEIYFEPYYHVLKALQDPSFPEHIAMKKYLIDVNPEPQPPAYLKRSRSLNVLDFDSWPSSKKLKVNFNESQYEAYKTALTHEFAVIQGPPGTGKTYLGVKVVKTLLQNIRSPLGPRCVLLLVCYTNHALDQFLEAILQFTESVVRIGGQSRNEAMSNINLNILRLKAQRERKKERVNPWLHERFYERRQLLQNRIITLNRVQQCIESLYTCVLSYESMSRYGPPCAIEFYKKIKRSDGKFKDPLYCWLFESVVYDFNEPITLEDEEIGHPNNNAVDESDDRQEVTLDDFEIDDRSSFFNMTSFSIVKSQEELKRLSSRYRNSKTEEEKHDIHRDIIITRSLIRTFKEMRSYNKQGVKVSNQVDLRDPSSISPVDRWMLYFSWLGKTSKSLKIEIDDLQDRVTEARELYEESRTQWDYALLKNFKVIGMTTSGAARLRKLIEKLAPPIVIVEEAAEVMEQHIVTALTKSCQHLILIGDHQQLRPSASYMRLARHYNIEVSLFERMIMNNVHSRCLTVQHRMRPEIAALIAPAIYPDLQNHHSVNEFPDVRGVTCNVFFLTHNYKEEVVDDSASKTNEREGDMVLGLANYLMQQDYRPEDVTILAAYAGQMFYMKKQRPYYSHLSKVKITVVDNYQGEESKIILLSLVRNNDENKIGFLGTENRVCVALSRAKEGFYMFGNIDILKRNSPLWRKIAVTLESSGSLGTSIRLMCENHNDKISVISTPEDFSRKVPEGGCLQKCSHRLACLHACPLMCHGYDRDHETITECTLKCEKIICELNHVCPLKCMEVCKPCIVKIWKKLPCGHDMSVSCHIDPSDPTVQCLKVVPVKLPSCGHEVKKSCYMAPEMVKCPVPCKARIAECGHLCARTCHVADDPHHERYLCQKPCAKAKRGCTTKLEGDRGDHQCVKMCHEECDECDVEVVKKRVACKHKERVACSRSPDEKPCINNCARVLPCGHFCRKKCFEPCGNCEQIVKKQIPECGHEISLKCGLKPERKLCENASCRRAVKRDECSVV